MNKDNLDLLHILYKIADLSTLSLKRIIPEINHKELLEPLCEQYGFYKKVKFDSGSKLLGENINPIELSAREKASTIMHVRLGLNRDKSDANVASMVMLGTTKNIIRIMRAKSNHSHAEKYVVKEIDEIIDKQNEFIEKMQIFL